MKARGVLLGLESRGKFGNIAVASLLRGLQIIKAKKDPANPNSPKQKTQRKIYSEGRLYYHALRLTNRDKNALSRLSRLSNLKLNPFQFFMYLYIYAIKIYGAFRWARNADSKIVDPTTLFVSCEFPTGGTLYVGITNKFNLNFKDYSISEVGGTGVYQGNIPNLVAGIKYYFLFLYAIQPYVPPWWEKITIFFDDFSDGNYNGWNVTAGTWTANLFYLKSVVSTSFIHTIANAVPAGEKYWTYKHVHFGLGGNDYSSNFQPIYSSSTEYLRCVYYSHPTWPGWYYIQECIGGVRNTLFTSTKYDYKTLRGNWFCIKIYKYGTALKFKIWRDIEPEPAGWDWEGNCNPALVDEGKIACHNELGQPLGSGFDDIEVYRLVYHPPIEEIRVDISGLYAQQL